jgi:hypothetical protein
MNAQGRVPNEAARGEISDTIAAYVNLTKGSHDWRAAAFAVTEMLAIANIVIQMFFLDDFNIICTCNMYQLTCALYLDCHGQGDERSNIWRLLLHVAINVQSGPSDIPCLHSEM